MFGFGRHDPRAEFVLRSLNGVVRGEVGVACSERGNDDDLDDVLSSVVCGIVGVTSAGCLFCEYVVTVFVRVFETE